MNTLDQSGGSGGTIDCPDLKIKVRGPLTTVTQDNADSHSMLKWSK